MFHLCYHLLKFIYLSLAEIILLPLLAVAACLARWWPRKIEVGLGPEPLINNLYHKQALQGQGICAETFVIQTYFITSAFDQRFDQHWLAKWVVLRPFFLSWVFLFSIFRYRTLYLYFNGGPLFDCNIFLWRWEPLLLQLANVKVLVMPYGGDVQELTRSENLSYKSSIMRDYPGFRHRRVRIGQQIDLWTRHADHIIAGCDWVDYLYHWDTLMLAHFSIDMARWQAPPLAVPERFDAERPLRVLHSPNHRRIKGTKFFLRAIERLQAEGEPVELVLLEGVPNDKVHEVMASVDVVADQLIIGWYAMFALEALSMGKVVLCYLREDFEQLYTREDLIEPGEIPIVNTTPETVYEQLRELIHNPQFVAEIGERGRPFVQRHHSLEAIGKVFANIQTELWPEKSA